MKLEECFKDSKNRDSDRNSSQLSNAKTRNADHSTGNRDSTQHTVRLPVEDVVVLGKVGDDAQTIRHLRGRHVIWIQQRRDAQLHLCNLKRLQSRKDKQRMKVGQCKERVAQKQITHKFY